MAKQKNKAPQKKGEEGLPAWVATFGDLMSLMLTFFVLMLSFANMDIQKYQDMMGSIKDAFGVQVKRKQADYVAFSPSKMERKEVELDQENRVLLGMVMRLKALIKDDEKLRRNVDVSPDDQGVLVRVSNSFLFDPGSAKLKKEAKKALSKIIATLKEHNFDLVIRGHTDNTPVISEIYPSNWELSAARAATALRYIAKKGGISTTRLKAVGYADTRPLVPNNSDKNRARNRRVEFYFHRPEVKGW
jgi:chemotaxis protein MotB